MAALPILIQFSPLFTIGHINMHSCGVITVVLGIAVLFYAVTTSISVLVSSSPFRSSNS